MSRFSRILRPVLAGLLALVLAAVGAVIGTRLAAPDDVVIAQTVEATVLPAIPVDAVPDFDDENEVEEFLATPPEAASVVEVPLGSDIAAAAEDFDALLAEVETASDPVSEATVLYPASGLLPPADPCAADPDTCPAGLLSTVLSLRPGGTPPPPLQIVRAGLPERGSEWGSQCRRADGLPVYAVETNQPVDGELVFWPHGNPRGVTRVDIQTSTSDHDDWWILYLTDAAERIPTITYCLPLRFSATGMHEADLTVHSDTGTLTRHTQFSSTGELSLPQSWIFTPSEDVITAIVPYRLDERVAYELHDLAPANPEAGTSPEWPTCDAPRDDDDRGITPVGAPRVWAITADVVLARNEDPAYTERQTASFSVGEGTTTLVCVRVLGPDDSTTRLISAIVSTRDVSLPVISVVGVGTSGTQPVVVTGYTGIGTPCGSWYSGAGDYSRMLAEPSVLCDYAATVGSIGVERPPAGREVPLSNGYLDRYSIAVAAQDDPLHPTVSTIDLAAIAACAALTCAPPTPSYHLARNEWSAVLVRVDWTSGTGTNNARSTTVTSFQDRPAEASVPPYPLLDVASTLVTPEPGGNRHSLAVRFRTNTTADYTVRLVAAAGSDAICSRGDGSATQQSGTFEVPDAAALPPTTEVVFRDLCGGTSYQVQVLLTDAFAIPGGPGVSSIWGTSPDFLGAPTAFFGGDFFGSRVTTPRNLLNIGVQVQVLGVDDVADNGTRATPVAVFVRANGMNLVGPGQAICPATVGEFSDPVGSRVVAWGAETVHVSGSIQRIRTCPAPGGTAQSDPDLVPFTFSVDLPYAAIVEAEGAPVEVLVFRDQTLDGVGTFRVPVAKLIFTTFSV